MRIFEVLQAQANCAVPENLTWRRNLYEPLVEMGHNVVLFWAEEGQRAMEHNDRRARGAFSQKLLDAFRQEHAREPFDLFFAYLKDGMVEPCALDDIRDAGVPACNFSCNNIHQFYLVDEISPHFDYNLHSERDAREKFLAIGANPVWWPMASNPSYFKPLDLPRTTDVSFVGANYALRARYLAHLLDNGIDAHAYGPGWRSSAATRWRSSRVQWKASTRLADHDFRSGLAARFPNNLHGSVSDAELIALYSRSHVSLGFIEVFDRHDPSRPIVQHLHLREFEGPMSGALYCTGYTDELAEFFEPDKEVLIYRNQHELLDKVRYYLAHQDEAEKIRQAGHARALRDHTYRRRFEALFREIGLGGH
jgi:spore maturation protein CgeB